MGQVKEQLAKEPRIVVVAPCHIPPTQAWIDSLKDEASANGAEVLIVDDSDGNLGELPEEWMVFGYEKQEQFLGELYPEFARMFHKSSACRVFGHIFAYSMGFDIIIGLDSDCIVKRHFIRDHVQFLGTNYGSGWFNPIGYPHYSRGYPYSQRGWEVVANMGLWENVLDINGKDRQDNEPTEIKIQGSTVPNGYFPFSGMNFALTRDAMWGFLFLPNFNDGEDKFRRIDDIWGGYIFQKLARMLKKSSMVGYPFVYHDTVVIAEEDAKEEEAMYKFEDYFIEQVEIVMTKVYAFEPTDMKMAMQLFAVTFAQMNYRSEFEELIPAFKWWAEVIKAYGK